MVIPMDLLPSGSRRPSAPACFDAEVYHKLRAVQWDDPEGRAEVLASLREMRAAHTVLDLGAGTGAIAGCLGSRIGGRLLCVDCNHAAIRIGRKAAPAADWILADACAFPLRDQTVGAVLTSMIFHQVVAKEALLSEIVRVLEPEGTWVLIQASPQDVREFVLYRACPTLLSAEEQRFWTLDRICSKASDHGFFLRRPPLRVRPSQEITRGILLETLRQRFVSVLLPLSWNALCQVISSVDSYLTKRSLDAVPTYSYHVLVFGKRAGYSEETA